MKGIIFNLLEEVISVHHGEIAWPDLVDMAGVSGAYTSLGSYHDGELLTLVDTAAAVLGLTPGQVLRWFGRGAMPLLARRFPGLFANHTSARSLICSVNEIIHPEVRKLYSGAGCPHFHFTACDDGALIMAYQSPRHLCALAEGFVEGASDHFGEAVIIKHLTCMLDDQPLCRIAVWWPA